jgi:PAS domain S-box-containing protein
VQQFPAFLEGFDESSMNSRNGSAASPRWGWLSAGTSALAVALGLAVLLGWHAHSPRITNWLTGTTPTAYNTALSFVILGTALLAVTWGHRRLSATLGILGGLLSLLTLFEYVAGVSLGIDELLMKSAGSSTSHPGRIAPNTAVCLVLLSSALLCMKAVGGFRRQKTISPLLASVALGVSAISLAGYLTGFTTFVWGPLNPMAVPTSVGLTLLSISALSSNWRESDLSRGTPSWLYITVTVAAVVMTVSLWQALASEEHARIEYAVAGQLEVVRVSLLTDMEYRIAAVARFARRWAITGQRDPRRWEFETGLLVKDVQGFEAFGWVDPDSRIRWVYSRERNEALLGADLSSDASRRIALETARDTRRTIITRPIRLLAGGDGINAYVPIFRGSAFQGFIVAGFRFQDLFRHVVDPTLARGYALEIYDGDQRIYFHAPREEQRGRVWERQASLQFENVRWTLKLWPTPAALANAESTASMIVLAAGLLLSVLLGLAVYLAQAARVKTQMAERARGELEREVVERRRAEHELDQFFSVTPDMLCVAGFDGYFKRLNPAWVGVLGWSVEQLLKTPYGDLIHPDDVNATKHAVLQQQAGASVLSFENRYRAQDGSYRWMQWNSRPIPERQLIFAAARDVTAEKLATEELQRSRDELEQRVRERTAELTAVNQALQASNQEMEAFTYSVAHDLRAPLRQIDGFSKILLEVLGAKLDPSAQRYLNLVREGAGKMDGLVNDLLALAQVGRQEVRRQAIGLNTLVEQVVADLHLEIAGRLIDWRIGPLPVVECDPGLVTHVLMNLLSNAVKFTRTRAQAIIEVGFQKENRECVFFVRDNGVGFDMKYAAKLFGVFQRLHPPQDFEGTGVGLATVQRILQKHGGRIWAEAEHDRGAVFYFTLRPEELVASSLLVSTRSGDRG